MCHLLSYELTSTENGTGEPRAVKIFPRGIFPPLVGKTSLQMELLLDLSKITRIFFFRAQTRQCCAPKLSFDVLSYIILLDNDVL